MMVKPVEVRLYPRKSVLSKLDACAGVTLTPDDIAFHESEVFIEGVGWIVFRGPEPSTFETAHVIERGGRWYLVFSVMARVRPLPTTDRSVGVDVGVYYLIYTSDKRWVRPNGDVVRLDKLIDKQRAALDTKQPGSTRYRELTRRIARNRKRIFDKQLDQANKIANALVRRYDFIALEDINPQGKTIQHDPEYKKAAQRLNWYLLRDVIQLRAYETGRTVIMTPPWWTSQTCSACDRWVRHNLEDRVHECPYCGYRTSRDHNAAQVILKRGERIAAGSQRTNWFPLGHPKYDPYDD